MRDLPKPPRSETTGSAVVSRQLLEQRYDQLYERVETLLAGRSHALCAVEDGRCVRGRRRGLDDGFCCSVVAGDPDFPASVGRCRYLGAKGCTVQSLRCRLWFCRHVDSPTQLVTLRVGRRRSHQFRTLVDPEMMVIVGEAELWGFLVPRGSREDNLASASVRFGIEHGDREREEHGT